MNSNLLKSSAELHTMRHAGQLLASVFAMLDSYVREGISTMDINQAVDRFIRRELKARPASVGQYDYPYALNASINDEVCHGMPSSERKLCNGDILNLDITLEKNGFIADSSKMYMIGSVSEEARRLVQTTYDAMWAGIRQVRPGATLGDVGHAIQRHAEVAGYSVVREYCGHGIGREMHEEPEVLHYGRPGTGLKLKPGMVFTIEPMINQGTARLRHKRMKNGWDIALTHDQQLSAQWEHTIAVTPDGYEVLTLRPEELAE
ncbi:type I methionyl aminopeptidase [Nitrincola sp. MINF-07-Sa-05]|uniref:type I methionyl aminopeptidase n=1 Tax=Nitrincola salilacus TaxID=3400273 RepID=UPI0039185918